MKIYIANAKQVVEIVDISILTDVTMAYLNLKGYLKLDNISDSIFKMILSEKLNLKNPQFIININYNLKVSSVKYINDSNIEFNELLNRVTELQYADRCNKINTLLQ